MPCPDLPLSVLDTAPIVAGSSARRALHHSVELARLADELGYRRYWVAEHHGMRGVASCATSVLIAQLACATRRIRVGSGAILLPNHAPITVAEEFGTLEIFHPGRIDLGIGRALGGTRRAVDRVRSPAERTAKPFAAQLDELLGYFAPPPPDAAVRAIPAVGNRPPLWLLGSTATSAGLAAERGLPYAFAHHLNATATADAVVRYRDDFRPGHAGGEPTLLLSVSVITATRSDQAHRLAAPIRFKTLSRLRGQRILLPTTAEALAHAYTDEDLADIAEHTHGLVVGDPDTVTAALQSLLDDTGATELMITTPVHDHAERMQSYRLLAALVGPMLKAPAPTDSASAPARPAIRSGGPPR